jgi:hypothetical protein
MNKLTQLGSADCPACRFALPEGSKFCSECGISTQEALGQSQDEGAKALVVGFARDTAREAGQLTRTVLKHDLTHKVVAGAAIGAAVAAIIPIVTFGLGAAVGGGIVAYKRLLK